MLNMSERVNRKSGARVNGKSGARTSKGVWWNYGHKLKVSERVIGKSVARQA